MKFQLILLAMAGACFLSCERHEFTGDEGTKQLNEPHGDHAAGHGEAHGGQHDAAGHTEHEGK